ncbi:MAG: peptidoglycan editing factor PgeF [Rhodospirillales bacterium]
MLRLAVLDGAPGVRHAFFTRDGGVSGGIYASLNCGFGSGDRREDVAENRARALRRLDPDAGGLVTAHQVHSADAVTVTAPWKPGEAPRADAMVTDRPGVALGILTADCAPVLFADAGAGVIGAAHAGWRGALTGVLEATVAAMEGLGADRSRIRAAIGPCIGRASYEVGPEFPAPFLAADADAATLFDPSPRPGHHRFDLEGYAWRRLVRLGLAAVDAAGRDTCAEDAAFFSYRRTCLNGGRDYGRGLSAIVLAG